MKSEMITHFAFKIENDENVLMLNKIFQIKFDINFSTFKKSCIVSITVNGQLKSDYFDFAESKGCTCMCVFLVIKHPTKDSIFTFVTLKYLMLV